MLFVVCVLFFFFKQKTAYEMRISDWSSDVCSSDLEYNICRFKSQQVVWRRMLPHFRAAIAALRTNWAGSGAIRPMTGTFSCRSPAGTVIEATGRGRE